MITRYQKLIIITAAGMFLLVAAAWAGIYFYLPNLLENRLLPHLARSLGLTPEQVRVQRIGLTATDLGPMRFSAGGRPVLSAGSIHLRYSPRSMLQGRIDGLTIMDLSIELGFSDNGFRVVGIPQPFGAPDGQRTGPQPAQTWPRRLEALLPLSLKSIVLQNAQVMMVRDNRTLAIPLSAEIDASGLRQGRLDGTFRLRPFDSRIKFKARMDTRKNTALLELTQFQADLGKFGAYLAAPAGMRLAARIDAQGKAECRLAPFELNSLNISAALGGMWIERPGIQLTVQPVRLDLAARRNAAGPLEFQLSAKPPEGTQPPPVGVKYGSMQMAVDLAQVEMDGTYQDRSASIGLRMHAPGIRFDGPGNRMSGRQFKLTADAAVDFSGPQAHISGQTHAEMAEVAAQKDSLQMRIALLSAAACWIHSPGSHVKINGDLQVSRAAVADSRRSWKANGVNARVPISWPLTMDAPPGDATVASLQWHQHQLGGIQGTLQQRAGGFSMTAEHTSQLFPGLIVFMNGRLEPGGGSLDWRVPAYRTGGDIDLGRFFPKAAGYDINGQLKAKGRLVFKGSSARGRAEAGLDDGHLRHAGSGLNLNGIRAGVQFKNIFKMETDPGQFILIRDLQMGTIRGSDLNVAFQIKGPDTIRIEGADMAWCDGTIRTAGIDLQEPDDTIEAVVIGKDLNPVMVMQQLGVAQGKGQGTVSGKIPFTWRKGRLRFDNGRLASPPGQSGTIQLERLGGSEYLYSGLPEGTPQRTQLDIALEALKDYTYERLELRLESDREELLLRLRLNGRPNRLLPFEYDSQAGKFSRATGQGQAEFKGIDIDLNFRSPIDELLRYRELLK